MGVNSYLWGLGSSQELGILGNWGLGYCRFRRLGVLGYWVYGRFGPRGLGFECKCLAWVGLQVLGSGRDSSSILIFWSELVAF